MLRTINIFFFTKSQQFLIKIPQSPKMANIIDILTLCSAIVAAVTPYIMAGLWSNGLRYNLPMVYFSFGVTGAFGVVMTTGSFVDRSHRRGPNEVSCQMALQLIWVVGMVSSLRIANTFDHGTLPMSTRDLDFDPQMKFGLALVANAVTPVMYIFFFLVYKFKGMVRVQPAAIAPSTVAPAEIVPDPVASDSEVTFTDTVLGNAEDEIHRCKICSVNKIAATLLPCGHALSCNECSSILINGIGLCPTCRTPIDATQRLFYG